MDLTIQPGEVLYVLVPTVFVPVALGFLLHRISMETATAVTRVTNVVDVVGTGASVAVILSQGFPALVRVPLAAIVGTVLITAGDAAFGFWAARPNRAEQKAIAAAAALGNPALALVVVELVYHEMRALVLVSVYVVVRAIAILPLVWWLRRLAAADTLK